MGEQRAIAPQLGGAAQHAVDEEAVHHDARALGGRGMTRDEFVRHRAGKPPVAAVAVEAQQVIAIDISFADPQFADGAAVGQRLVHVRSPAWKDSPADTIWCNAAKRRPNPDPTRTTATKNA